MRSPVVVAVVKHRYSQARPAPRRRPGRYPMIQLAPRCPQCEGIGWVCEDDTSKPFKPIYKLGPGVECPTCGGTGIRS